MRIFTSRYNNRALTGMLGRVVPVCISVGVPRWNLPFDLRFHLEVLKPHRLLLKEQNQEKYRESYVRKLEAAGMEAIGKSIEQVSAAAGGRDPVLLCFENVAGGEWCHRRMFAEWWVDRIGEPVDELELMTPEEIAAAFDGEAMPAAPISMLTPLSGKPSKRDPRQMGLL